MESFQTQCSCHNQESIHTADGESNNCPVEDNTFLKDGIEQLNEQIGALYNQTNGRKKTQKLSSYQRAAVFVSVDLIVYAEHN